MKIHFYDSLGSPAHAGIDPIRRLRIQRSFRLPRTRGDRPSVCCPRRISLAGVSARYARVRGEIEAAGGQWAVAKGLDDALATLEHWGAIKPDLSMKCQMISGKGVMGGIGSGRYGGYRAATCEDDYAIDLPWLWQEGVLRRLGRDKGKRGHAGNQAALNRGR